MLLSIRPVTFRSDWSNPFDSGLNYDRLELIDHQPGVIFLIYLVMEERTTYGFDGFACWNCTWLGVNWNNQTLFG